MQTVAIAVSGTAQAVELDGQGTRVVRRNTTAPVPSIKADRLMLWDLSVTEQRFRAVLEEALAGVPVIEVADRYEVSIQNALQSIASLTRRGQSVVAKASGVR